MRFKNSPQHPGAGRTRVWNHHGSDTPTSPRAIYVLKSAKGPNIFFGGGSVRSVFLSSKVMVNFKFSQSNNVDLMMDM